MNKLHETNLKEWEVSQYIAIFHNTSQKVAKSKHRQSVKGTLFVLYNTIYWTFLHLLDALNRQWIEARRCQKYEERFATEGPDPAWVGHYLIIQWYTHIGWEIHLQTSVKEMHSWRHVRVMIDPQEELPPQHLGIGCIAVRYLSSTWEVDEHLPHAWLIIEPTLFWIPKKGHHNSKMIYNTEILTLWVGCAFMHLILKHSLMEYDTFNQYEMLQSPHSCDSYLQLIYILLYGPLSLIFILSIPQWFSQTWRCCGPKQKPANETGLHILTNNHNMRL